MDIILAIVMTFSPDYCDTIAEELEAQKHVCHLSYITSRNTLQNLKRTKEKCSLKVLRVENGLKKIALFEVDSTAYGYSASIN